MNKQEELNEYSKMVRELRDYNSTNDFPNRGYSHAAIVLSNIFEAATKEINVLTEDFGKDKITDELILSIENFLDKDKVKLNILHTGKIEENKRISHILSKENVNKFHIKPELIRNQFLKGNDYHFTTADDKMYRFETDIKTQTALCSFNNEKNAKGLSRLFKKMLDSIKE